MPAMRLRILYIDINPVVSSPERRLKLIFEHFKKHHCAFMIARKGEVSSFLKSTFSLSLPPFNSLKFKRKRGRLWLPEFKAFLSHAQTFFRIYKTARNLEVDVIHATGFYSAIHAALLGRIKKIPVVWHLVDFWPLRGIPNRIMVKLLLKDTKKIAISESIKRAFERSGFGRVEVVYGGNIDGFFPEPRKEARKKLNLPDGFLVGYSGKIFPGDKKGIKTLLHAFSMLPEKRNAYLVLCGEFVEGYEKNFREDVKEAGIDGRVIQFSLPPDKMRYFFSAVDVTVLVSEKEEGLGMSLVESLACETPVIGSKAGGIEEVVRDRETGILVPPKDHEALKNALLFMMENPEKRKKMGKKGREDVLLRFSPERMLKRIEEIYHEVLGERGRA